MLALAVALSLVPPVPGAPARPFAYPGDPFAAGHHRGLDLAARAGEPVRAACGGRVAFAGRAGANGRAVTIRCGRWNVTHLPLRDVAPRAGDRIRAGTRVGTLGAARGHTGLHVGVRLASDPFGYVDPAPLLRAEPPPPPPAGPRRIVRPRPHAAPRRIAWPRPHAAPRWIARSRPPAAPHPAPAPSPAVPRPGSSPAAPWPAWTGLALLLAGAAGAGTVRVRRTRRAALARGAAAPVR